MNTATPSRYYHIPAILFVFVSLVLIVKAGQDEIHFSFENHEVNQSLITLYENQPAIWKIGQLSLIGRCYINEGNLEKAQKVYETLHDLYPTNYSILISLGNIHHMKGENTEAYNCYSKAWIEGRNVDSLALLAALKLQGKDIDGLKLLVDELIRHQSENENIPKVLLAYCLMNEDKEATGRIFVAVVHKLDMELVEQNPDLRKMLMLYSMKYAAETNLPKFDHTSKSREHGQEGSFWATVTNQQNDKLDPKSILPPNVLP